MSDRWVVTSLRMDADDHLFVKNNHINIAKMVRDMIAVLRRIKSDEELTMEEDEHLRRVAEIRVIKAARAAEGAKLSSGEVFKQESWDRLCGEYRVGKRGDRSDVENVNWLVPARRDLMVRAGFEDPVVCLEALRKECG